MAISDCVAFIPFLYVFISLRYRLMVYVADF